MSSKSGFQFKQFYIEHSQCAMKVGTDSIMLGSWINPEQAQTVLDIGTGSGLLAVMLAQKAANNCKIYGLDIDPIAVKQAQENGQNSPWYSKLNFAHLALQDLQYQLHWPQCFDLILSNPPYFVQNSKTNQQNSLNTQSQRVQARQVASLEHLELLKYVNTHLTEKGLFYCILPVQVSTAFIEQAAKQNLFLAHQMQVKSTKDGKMTRQLMKFSRYSTQTQYDELVIYSAPKQYSANYIELCQAYYLQF
jgi:tRNA1Val (adenine37-N6)-methyltransferase